MYPKYCIVLLQKNKQIPKKNDKIKLHLNRQNVLIETVVLKTVCKELRNRIITSPTVQLNYNAQFVHDDLE